MALSGEGTGFAPALLATEPAVLDFGEVAWPEASPPRLVQVTNEGDLASGPLDLRIQGRNPDDYAIVPEARADACEDGAPLAGRASCTVSLVFEPTGEGQRQATLDVAAPGAAAEPVALAGLGSGFGPSLLVRADDDVSSDYGDVEGVEHRDLVFSNAGGLTTGSLGVRLQGSEAFRIGAGADRCSGRTLPSGALCSVGVTFEPGGNGDYMATLRVADAQDEVVVELTGRGVGFLPPELVAEPEEVDFGDLGDAERSAPFTVRFGNFGEQAATGLEVRVEGQNADLFELLDTPLPCVGRERLAANEECRVAMQLVPGGQAGSFSATLTLDANEDSVSVALAGRSGAPESCAEIKAGNEGAASGVYSIDPDGDGGLDPIDVYCQMEWGGGGWTLAMSRAVDLSSPNTYGHSITWDCLDPSTTPPVARDADADEVLQHSAVQALGVTEMMLMGGDRILKLYYARPGVGLVDNYRRLTQRSCADANHYMGDAPHTGLARGGTGHADDACTTTDWAGFQARDSCGRDAGNSHQDPAYCGGLCGSFGNEPGHGTSPPGGAPACWFYGGDNAAQQPQITNCPAGSRAPWANYSTGTLEGHYNLWVR